MKTLNSLFKQVFANGLREYGYIKIKGRQPYFARMIGDEIVQVITYENVWCGDARGYKAFGISGGGATVYRETINLNRSPRQNNEWLNDLSDFYVNKDPKNFDKLPSAEGLLYIKTDNHDDFIERYREKLSIAKALIELQKRKESNIKILRSYGLEV